MKIIAINASYRGDKGHTRFLIDKLFKGATECGVECEVVTLSKKKINICKACNICQTEKHYLKCVLDGKDDVLSIFNKMASADIIVFATPVYIFGISGLMKIFLDRIHSTSDVNDLKVSKSGLLFHHINHSICSKPFVTLVCFDNLEDETPKNVLSYFKTYSKFMDAPQVGMLIRNVGGLTGHGKDPEKEKKFPKIYDVYNAYEQAGCELAEYGKITSKTQKRANQEIIPVPLFRFIKKIKPLKKKLVEEARKMR
jgi:multimeric flavodoxin WrbA